MNKNMEQVADFFSLYKEFTWEKNMEGMINLYDENVIVFDMWDKAQCLGLRDWSTIIRQWLGALNGENVNVIFENIHIQSGESISFASAIIIYQAISQEHKVIRSMRNRITLGFAKTDAIWKVVHQHTSAPVDANLRAILAE